MIDKRVAWRLVERAGPVIRYRTLREILQVRDVEIISNSLEGLLGSSIVREGLDFLWSAVMHDDPIESTPNVVSAIARLVQLGVRTGLQQMDRSTIRIRSMLSDDVINDNNASIAIAEALAYAGYYEVPKVKSLVIQRLDRLISANYKSLPRFHDLLGISNIKWAMRDDKFKQLADRVASIIVSLDYQTRCQEGGFVEGEGLWNCVNLPGFREHPEIEDMGLLILILDLLAPLTSVQESEWFKRCMEILEERRGVDGLYRFPSEWLPEGIISDWPRGMCMSLEISRDDEALAYESTFRVLKIKSCL